LGKDCSRGEAIRVKHNECACRYSHVKYLAYEEHVSYYIVYLTVPILFPRHLSKARIKGEKIIEYRTYGFDGFYKFFLKYFS